MKKLETEYLIIGSGLVGMAFADTLLTETDANLAIVDQMKKADANSKLLLGDIYVTMGLPELAIPQYIEVLSSEEKLSSEKAIQIQFVGLDCRLFAFVRQISLIPSTISFKNPFESIRNILLQNVSGVFGL